MNELKIFKNENLGQVRVIDQNGEPYFVLKDVCDVLEIKNSRDVSDRLDEDEKGVDLIDTLGGRQEMTVINESGLYNVILRSDKPQAKQFKKWITAEVLPSIRKHGAYMTPETVEKAMHDPDFVIGLLTNIKAMQSKIEADKPKIVFADAVDASHTSILIGDLAKLIKQNGIEIGQKRLFAWLRENGYLIKRQGADYNMPMQRYMEQGLFSIKETAITHADGHVSISKTVKVTGKGQLYFINKFLS